MAAFHSATFVGLFTLIGLVLGSFGNVLVWRVPRRESILGRSRCPHCKRSLKWFELVPLFSYLFLRGRCRTCEVFVSLRYPFTEAVSALLFLAVATRMPGSPIVLFGFAFALWLLFLIAIVDGTTGLVPDVLSIPLIILAVLLGSWTFDAILARGIGLLIGGGFIGAQWLLSRGRWVGSGDILIGGAAGALVGGPTNAVILLLVSYISGSLFALGLLALRKTTFASRLAFGPFLAFGGIVVFLWSEPLRRLLSL